MAWDAASSTSASSRTMKALSPPSSSRMARRSVAAEAAMARPTSREPVKSSRSSPRWSASAQPASATVAGDHVEDSGGQPDGLGGLGQHVAADERGQLGGLEHDGVAERQAGRDHPHGEVHRVVPRGDDPDDAQRHRARQRQLARLVRGQDVPGVLGRLDRGDEELADARGHLVLGLGPHPARLADAQLDQLFVAALEVLGETPQVSGPLGCREGGPGGLRGAGRGDGPIDVGGTPERVRADPGTVAFSCTGRRVPRRRPGMSRRCTTCPQPSPTSLLLLVQNAKCWTEAASTAARAPGKRSPRPASEVTTGAGSGGRVSRRCRGRDAARGAHRVAAQQEVLDDQGGRAQGDRLGAEPAQLDRGLREGQRQGVPGGGDADLGEEPPPEEGPGPAAEDDRARG